MTEKYEYCSTVPRIFVQDCSYIWLYMVVFFCDLCFLSRTNMCVMKWSENVMLFGIKRNCNLLDLDKVSPKLASKNLVRSKSKPRFKIFSVLFYRKGFPYGLLQAENIRSACYSWVVLSKLLAARKANFFISTRAHKKIAVLACSWMLAKTIHTTYICYTKDFVK